MRDFVVEHNLQHVQIKFDHLPNPLTIRALLARPTRDLLEQQGLRKEQLQEATKLKAKMVASLLVRAVTAHELLVQECVNSKQLEEMKLWENSHFTLIDRHGQVYLNTQDRGTLVNLIKMRYISNNGYSRFRNDWEEKLFEVRYECSAPEAKIGE